MLGNNIVTYRKKLGLSQQQLADRMNVVRQTVSKWEKDLSVPDADALVRLADALDVTVPELLGQPVPEDAGVPEYAAVLAQIAEQMAAQNRRRSRIWKIVAWVLGILLLLNVLNIVGSIIGVTLYQADLSNGPVIHQEQTMMDMDDEIIDDAEDTDAADPAGDAAAEE